jgi:hypothetical protein
MTLGCGLSRDVRGLIRFARSPAGNAKGSYPQRLRGLLSPTVWTLVAT